MNRNATAGSPDTSGRQRLRKRGAAFLLCFFLGAFMLNFFWESLHGLLFAGHPEMPAERYVPMMVHMALPDALSMTEYIFVHLLHAWAYTASMPLVFGVGLSPLLQLACTGLPALLTAHGMTRFFNEQP